jgi:Sulfatase
VHLTVLWSFAFAQPLLDLLGDAPEFFVARGNTRGDILLLALGLMLVPPLLLTALEAAVGLVSAPARQALHLGLVGLLTAAFVLQLIKDVSVPSAILVAAALALGCLATAFYARSAAGPAILTVLSPAPLVFLFLFLILSPVSKLVLPGDEARAASVKVPSHAPVVVIFFDEFAGWTLLGRDGQIDANRYPNFARLANEATWYRNATTVADYTERAVPALLTGDRPDRSALPIASDHPESLFTLLGGSYRFDVTEPVTDVCPAQLCPEESATRPSQARRLKDLGYDLSLVSLHLLLPPSLRTGLRPVDRSFGDFRAQEPAQGTQANAGHQPEQGFAALAAVIDRMKIFRAFEQRLGATPQRNSLVFFHLQMPHNPYHYLPSGQRYPETISELPGVDTVNQPAAGRWSDDAELARQGLQRYLLQIGDTDRLLGRLIARMKTSGLYDKAVLVVAADHGASFMPGHPLRAADAEDLPSIASIPLFVKAPGQREGKLDTANVDITDVLPTIADRLGVKLPWTTDGQVAERASEGGEIRLQPHYGDADLTLPFADYVRRRDQLARSALDEFGSEPAGVYAGGADADLVGRVATDLATLPGARFELDGGGLLADVDPRGPIVPAFLTGELSDVPADARLAVAIDGRIAATAVQWRDRDVTRFSALVPPSAYAPGANSVDLIAVRGSGADRRLARLPGAQLGYRLTGSSTIVDGTGGRIRVAGDGGGKIDSLNVGQTDVTVTGTVDGAERVIAFAGARLLATGRPADGKFRLSGWVAGPTPGSPEAPVRVFAIEGRRALELPKPKPASFPSGR